jgi:hypothetical protein
VIHIIFSMKFQIRQPLSAYSMIVNYIYNHRSHAPLSIHNTRVPFKFIKHPAIKHNTFVDKDSRQTYTAGVDTVVNLIGSDNIVWFTTNPLIAEHYIFPNQHDVIDYLEDQIVVNTLTGNRIECNASGLYDNKFMSWENMDYRSYEMKVDDKNIRFCIREIHEVSPIQEDLSTPGIGLGRYGYRHGLGFGLGLEPGLGLKPGTGTGPRLEPGTGPRPRLVLTGHGIGTRHGIGHMDKIGQDIDLKLSLECVAERTYCS